jgi:HSP20 family protein
MANIIRRHEREQREVAPRARGFEPTRFDPFRMMGELLRWDPFADVDRWGGMQPGVFSPQVEVRETPTAFVFRADLPGVKEENVDISLTGNRLTISGERQEERRDENDRYHSYEVSYGSFSRSFSLPDGTDADNVNAQMKDGVLQITVPKRPEVQPRRIGIGQRPPGEGGAQSGPKS